MNTEGIIRLIDENINNVLTSDMYKRIISRGNNLIRYDIINRILIDIQNKDAFELKTEDEWLIENRRIKRGSKPIYILMITYNHKYIDKETKEVVKDNDLNLDELNKAIELDLVERIDVADNLYTVPVFDIKQTVGINKGERYEINKPVLNYGTIINILTNTLKCKVELSDKTLYKKEENKLYLKKLEYNKLVIEVSKEVARELSKGNELLRESIKYSTSSLLGVTYDIDFTPYLNDISNVINTITELDTIMYDIVTHIEFNKHSDNIDIIRNIELMRKGDTLLNIMQANKVNNLIHGN